MLRFQFIKSLRINQIINKSAEINPEPNNRPYFDKINRIREFTTLLSFRIKDRETFILLRQRIFHLGF